MNIEDIRDYCLQKDEVEESFPFGENTLVFKTRGRIFLLLSLDEAPNSINVKCDPELAIELRDVYSAVMPGYHMNKKHWNTIILDNTVPDSLLKECIDNSYLLVRKVKK